MMEFNPESVFRNLNFSLEQFEMCLNKICEGNNITLEKETKNAGKEIHYKTSSGLIRVYITKKGLTVDCSVCKDENFRKIVVEGLKSILESSIAKVKEERYTYKNRKPEEIEKVEKNLETCFKRDDYEYLSQKREIENVVTIKDKMSKEKIVVKLYKNGTIMIQGLCYMLWHDVAKVIEESLDNFSISETISRILLKEPEEIVDVNFQIYENKFRKQVGEEIYSYLDEIDKLLFTSCCCLIEQRINLPEYSPIVMPLYKGFEGYFRKVIKDLEFFEEVKTDAFWRIGKIFDRERCVMREKFKDEIKNKYNTDRIVSELEKLFKLLKTRDDVCHSGIPTNIVVTNFEHAVNHYKEVVKAMCSSYAIIKQFIP